MLSTEEQRATGISAQFKAMPWFSWFAASQDDWIETVSKFVAAYDAQPIAAPIIEHGETQTNMLAAWLQQGNTLSQTASLFQTKASFIFVSVALATLRIVRYLSVCHVSSIPLTLSSTTETSKRLWTQKGTGSNWPGCRATPN